jgi:hypothetical protein
MSLPAKRVIREEPLKMVIDYLAGWCNGESRAAAVCRADHHTMGGANDTVSPSRFVLRDE